MKKLLLSSLVGTTLLFTGCSTYNITPNYDKEQQTLKIDDLIFENVQISQNESEYELGIRSAVGNKIELYDLTKNECRLFYAKTEAGHAVYFASSLVDDLKAKKEFVCTDTAVSNVHMLECKSIESTGYYITTSTVSEHGVGYKSISMLKTNSSCFETIKDHFIQKAKKEDIKPVITML